jgi:hypothetical protein
MFELTLNTGLVITCRRGWVKGEVQTKCYLRYFHESLLMGRLVPIAALLDNSEGNQIITQRKTGNHNDILFFVEITAFTSTVF